MSAEEKTGGPEVIMTARNSTIAELVDQCANGDLPFSGPDSLCSKVAAMGYKTTYLHEMVCAAEAGRVQP